MRWGLPLALAAAGLGFAQDDYRAWDARRAQSIALAQQATGQVGRSLDFRVVSTDRSYNYKLRATWMTPEAIRACARLQQLARGLSVQETRKLVADAETAGGAVILVEIDPREGSGVIPRDWVATLGPRGGSRTVKGTDTPRLRDFPALAGGARRDYAYDLFWVVFPLRTEEGQPLFAPEDREAELTVRIYDKVGRVRWPVPSYAFSRPMASTR